MVYNIRYIFICDNDTSRLGIDASIYPVATLVHRTKPGLKHLLVNWVDVMCPVAQIITSAQKHIRNLEW